MFQRSSETVTGPRPAEALRRETSLSSLKVLNARSSRSTSAKAASAPSAASTSSRVPITQRERTAAYARLAEQVAAYLVG